MNLKASIAIFTLVFFVAGCGIIPAVPDSTSDQLNKKTWTDLLAEARDQDVKRKEDDLNYLNCYHNFFAKRGEDNLEVQLIRSFFLIPVGLAVFSVKMAGYGLCVGSLESPEGLIQVSPEEKGARRVRFIEDFIPQVVEDITVATKSFEPDSEGRASDRERLFAVLEQYRNALDAGYRNFYLNLSSYDRLKNDILEMGEINININFSQPYRDTVPSLRVSFDRLKGKGRGTQLFFSYHPDGRLEKVEMTHPVLNEYLEKLFYQDQFIIRRAGCLTVAVFAYYIPTNMRTIFEDPCTMYILNVEERAVLLEIERRTITHYIREKEPHMKEIIEKYKRFQETQSELHESILKKE